MWRDLGLFTVITLVVANHETICKHVQHALTLAGKDCRNKGKLTKALLFFRAAMKLQEKLAPDDSLDMACCYNDIGSVLRRQGDLQGAMDLHQRALAIQEPLAPYSLDVAVTYNNIGIVLKERGDLKAAMDVHQKALAMMRFRHGDAVPLRCHIATTKTATAPPHRLCTSTYLK